MPFSIVSYYVQQNALLTDVIGGRSLLTMQVDFKRYKIGSKLDDNYYEQKQYYFCPKEVLANHEW